VSGLDVQLTQFLVCTTCSISYIFADPSVETVVSTASMTFKAGAPPVEVNFVAVTMAMATIDNTRVTWTMQLGFIDPAKYQSATFFDFYYENMFGLAPMLTTNSDLLARQFLYQITNTPTALAAGFKESFAFNGG